MIIAKLIKPCKICIFESRKDGGEIESFSLLKLSLNEFSSLLTKAIELKKEIEYTLDDSVVIKYSGNDEIHQYWKKLSIEHEKTSPSNFVDVSAQFKSEISGTSCLIRDPVKHIIRIALRNGDDNVTINRMCIDNEIRERFFNDVKTTLLFKKSKKYAMDTQDLATYTYWSKYMNTSFINQFKKQKDQKLVEKAKKELLEKAKKLKNK